MTINPEPRQNRVILTLHTIYHLPNNFQIGHSPGLIRALELPVASSPGPRPKSSLMQQLGGVSLVPRPLGLGTNFTSFALWRTVCCLRSLSCLLVFAVEPLKISTMVRLHITSAKVFLSREIIQNYLYLCAPPPLPKFRQLLSVLYHGSLLYKT